MDRHKYHVLLFFLSIPFPFMLFKGWWSGVFDGWGSQGYSYLGLFAALAEVYFSRRKLVVAGLFGMGVFVVGILFRIMHWPGAALFILFGITSFMIIPLWSALQAREQKMLRIIISVWILIYGTGVLFLIFHWPGGGLLIILSMLALPVVTIALGNSLWQAKQKQNERNI